MTKKMKKDRKELSVSQDNLVKQIGMQTRIIHVQSVLTMGMLPKNKITS